MWRLSAIADHQGLCNLKMADVSKFVETIIEDAKEAEGVRDRKQACILTVPIALVGESTKFYYPQMVSIGPYHNHHFLSNAQKEQCKRLQGMETDKLVAARRFWKLIDQADTSQHTPKFHAIQKLCEESNAVRDKYDRDLSRFDKEKLSAICFVDAAFVLEFLNSFIKGANRLADHSHQSTSTSTSPCKGWESQHGIKSADPIFYERSNNPVLFTILMDVMKLENQLPMVVLKEAMNAAQQEIQLDDLLSHLCAHVSPIASQSPWPRAAPQPPLALTKCKHILDCLRTTLVAGKSWRTYKTQLSRRSSSSSSAWTLKSCIQRWLYMLLSPVCRKPGNPDEEEKRYLPYGATKLKKAGVTFRAMEKGEGLGGGLWDITFTTETGTLLLPKIDVGVWTETVFRNLLAYEAWYTGDDDDGGEEEKERHEKLITKFVLLMSQLVESEEDAELLREEHIIENNLGDNKQVAKLWNDISSSRWVPECELFDKLTKDLNDYLAQQWIGLFAEFWEQNCSKPWLFVAVIVGIMVLVETIISLWSVLKD